MPNLKALGLLSALPGLLLAIPVPASAQATGSAKTCKVTVDRSQEDGTFVVQRQELENADCVCYIYSGKDPQSADIESKIAGVISAQACPEAPLVAVPGVAAAGAVGAGIGGAGLGLAGLAAAGGAAAALSGGEDGPSSP